MSSSFTLVPGSYEDGPRLVRTQIVGFADDAFTRASFPNVPLEVRVKDSIGRWPANFSAPGSIYMKTVHKDTGEIVGYSKWQSDAALINSLKEKFGTNTIVEGAEKLEMRDPVGLNDDLAEQMSDKVVACRQSILGDRPRICELIHAEEIEVLSLLSTLPSYRGVGVASQHLEWATQLADKEKLPIWLDASPMSASLYRRFGFVPVGEVKSDLSIGSKGVESGTYVHTCMLREPREVES